MLITVDFLLLPSCKIVVLLFYSIARFFVPQFCAVSYVLVCGLPLTIN